MKENRGMRHYSTIKHTSELLVFHSWSSVLVYQSHPSPEGVSVYSLTSSYLDISWWLGMMEKTFLSVFLQVYSGADQKGSSRHCRVQSNGCNVRKVDRHRAPLTQRTEVWTPVMILSHRRKEHPVTAVPPKHTSTHLHGPLPWVTAAYSSSLSFLHTYELVDLWRQSVTPYRAIYVGWESSASLSSVNEV